MRLPSTLDLAAAAPLWSAFVAAKGQPLEVDASAVERLGGPCLQVLLAAKATWSGDGVAFAIVSPSEAFLSAVTLMGFGPRLDVRP